MQKLKIVYVGPLMRGGTSLMRMQALEKLGHTVTPVDTLPEDTAPRERRLISRILRKCGYPIDLAQTNRRILDVLRTESPDILWVDKGLTVRPSTLKEARKRVTGIRLVAYSPDDMSARHNQSIYYLAGLPLYDIHFTTKTYNVAELSERGARRVLFVPNAFDPAIHFPRVIPGEARLQVGGPVGFIGAYEPDRAQQMMRLAESGTPVRVWGWSDWSRVRGKHSNLRVEHRALFGEEYACAICSFDINLCFLRRINRDRQTTRSIEIPACGAFMLAERTEEHLSLFEEGKEAEFFGSTGELIEKARYYLANPALRQNIAAAGRQRCVRSRYDYPSRMGWMLEQV